MTRAETTKEENVNVTLDKLVGLLEHRDAVRVTVGPELASEILTSANKNNRNLSDTSVRKVARDILDGRWVYNGQSVSLSRGSDGTLLLCDGQHRLEAIVEANKIANGLGPVEVDMLFAGNVDYGSAMPTIDSGRSRRSTDSLRWAGYGNARNLAAAVNAVVVQEKAHASASKEARKLTEHFKQQSMPSIQEVMGFVKANPHVSEALVAAGCVRNNFKWMMTTGATAAIFFGWQKDRERTDQFFAEVADGQLLAKGDPSFALRSALMNRDAKKDKGEGRSIYWWAMINKALIAHIERRQILQLVWGTNEKFPFVQDADSEAA